MKIPMAPMIRMFVREHRVKTCLAFIAFIFLSLQYWTVHTKFKNMVSGYMGSTGQISSRISYRQVLHTTRERLDGKSFHKSKPYSNTTFHLNKTYQNNDHTILFWNVPDWFSEWIINADMNQCATYRNCKQTVDKSLFNQSKAVVFNLPDVNLGRKPPVSKEMRNADQVWVFFTLESPVHINPQYESPHWKNVFNWSWTYHPHADIFHPYGVLIENTKVPYKDYTAIYRKKTKLIAWAVSNCRAPSKRIEYVDILKRYVDVDIFGKCGNGKREELDGLINDNYKFYLGFENSLCDHYMTEKLFHYYKLDVISVLRGKTDYHKYLPAGSYIDTANFSTISDLAEFLKQLASDEEKYISYLKVKDSFMVYEREFMYKNALCNLCEKLNTEWETTQSYDDVKSWLGKCYDATDLRDGDFSFDVSANRDIQALTKKE